MSKLLDASGKRISTIDKTNAELGIESAQSDLTLPNGETALTIEEAFDIGFQEGVKHVETREALNDYLEKLAYQASQEVKEGEVFQVNQHIFGGGVYIRDQSVRLGHKISKHTHDYDHLSILMAGKALLEVEGQEPVTLTAGDIITVLAGKKHEITPLEGNIRWLCLHKHEDDSIASIGEVLTEKVNA